MHSRRKTTPCCCVELDYSLTRLTPCLIVSVRSQYNVSVLNSLEWQFYGCQAEQSLVYHEDLKMKICNILISRYKVLELFQTCRSSGVDIGHNFYLYLL